MSQYDSYEHAESYADDEDLADFIVDDGPHETPTRPDRHSEAHTDTPETQETPLFEPVTATNRLSAFNSMHQAKIPETARLLRAHISILCSALGGPDHASEKNVYKLGHDALACLKDIKRWLRAVDEKNGTYDVALACAECDLVKNDLTVILCQFDKPENGTRTRTTDKVMLACLELLVLLTWPTDVDRNTLIKDYTAKTSNRRAQLAYKHHILAYRNGRTLKAVLRLGLGALQGSQDEREPRDTNILRLILFFIRNVLYIEPLPATKGPKAVSNASALPAGVGAEEIALPAVVQAFERNNVLLFLTSVAHAVSGDLAEESFGLLVMECVSLLTRGVRPEEVAARTPEVATNATTNVAPAASVAGMDLQDLLGEEKRRQSHANSAIATRHGRFGTLLSIRNASNASYFAVSGQNALASTYDSLQKMDRTKKWHKPSTFKYDANAYAKKPSVYLGMKAAEILRKFISQLLVSGSFNNLLVFVGRHLTNLATDRDLGRRGILDAIDPTELSSYFLTIAWFFRYKRERSQGFVDQHRVPTEDEDGLDYGSVGAALSEVNFILLISYFRSSFEAKDYDSLHVAMVCLREMLLISNSIFSKKRTQEEIDLATEDDINEDRELAEGIIRKLFSQKQFLDMCVNIPKTASKHSPEYLGEVVSVVHILLKSFESLANEDVHLFIKTRRKMRKMERREGLNQEMDREHWHLIDRGSDEEDNEEEIRYITQERKLDLRNTEVKFFHPETVSTHIDYLSKYEDLSSEEIKRALSFFHRLFVVRKDFSSLYRMDFMLLLYKLQAYLPRSSSNRRHVDDFIVYFMKKFKSALDRFPMALEVLFPRLENLEMKGFLSTGDLHVFESKKKTSAPAGKNSYFEEDAVQPRAAPLIQFHDDSKTLDEKIGVLVYHLSKKKNTSHFLKLFSSELLRLSEKNVLDETVTLRLNLANRRLLISDMHLRLLLESIGFGLPYLQNDETTLHASVSPEALNEARESLNKWIELHAAGVGDIEPFLDQTHRLIISQEQLDFGVESLASLRAGKPFDEEKAAELELDEKLIHMVIGLAKRKEYDDKVGSQYYAQDEESSSDSTSEDEARTEKPKRKRRKLPESDDENSLPEDTPRARRARQTREVPREVFSDDEEARSAESKSAEMVQDSDDESDDEKNNAFFEKEEKLRQLISQTGGIASREQLNLFKESWNAILQSGKDSQVSEAVRIASGLFVSEDEDITVAPDPEMPVTTKDGSGMESLPEVEESSSVSRKRRMVIDDDDDDE